MGRHPVVPRRTRPRHRRGLRAVRRRPTVAGGAGPHAARGDRHRRPAHPAQGPARPPRRARPRGPPPPHGIRTSEGAQHVSPFLLTRTLPEDATDAALRADVLHGLSHTPKTLPPKWFYDAHGSELFDKITELPEYYPTRAEREILAARATDAGRGRSPPPTS
ncbi:L-histidine N(alpha)-methyltransferase, partial [Streptomyces sp. NPDC006333]|uniref:L-histidine N(alpha)-methyltransferase n=1 Tax=Streptomyces sp. NPDC006333 TaxID=3156753 RepID=UPI00339FCA14